eukprot:TRINITY_DN1024_c0_g1_i1.p1 TRINITY_DN1024_c0_g1~~TRINITY_DN1024_c0_g1_i1.p1  ORF type:complete len:111 (-),score=10.12 TRINITY_DN1024_c0_g1_i1:106-438(-)
MGTVSSSLAEANEIVSSDFKKNISEAQNNQIQRNLALEAAKHRERAPWCGLAWLIASGSALKMTRANSLYLLPPYLIFTAFCAYVVDYAYLGKSKRIFKIYEDSIKDQGL